jgi:recombination protein RecR
MARTCVVESPSDLLAVEQSHSWRGLYFVLMGRLSPLDGIGPREIHMDRLVARVAQEEVKEVVIATNFTPEGEAICPESGEKYLLKNGRVSCLASN